MPFTHSHISSSAVARSRALERLAYELLDAHADTERLLRLPRSELRWRVHLDYLRDLQRVAREVLADRA
jgi:hypothetical protein